VKTFLFLPLELIFKGCLRKHFLPLIIRVRRAKRFFCYSFFIYLQNTYISKFIYVYHYTTRNTKMQNILLFSESCKSDARGFLYYFNILVNSEVPLWIILIIPHNILNLNSSDLIISTPPKWESGGSD
jgi:hypothetical protein